jgi:hypothetical protein
MVFVLSCVGSKACREMHRWSGRPKMGSAAALVMHTCVMALWRSSDDCNAVNGGGTLAGIDDTVEYGFDVVGVGGLVVGCRGLDGKAENNNAASDLGVGPDTTFGKAESLGVGVGSGVIRHVDESRSVSGRDLEGGG